MFDNAAELDELLSHFVGINFPPTCISVGSTGNGYCTTCTCIYSVTSNFTDLISLNSSLADHLHIKELFHAQTTQILILIYIFHCI